MTDETQRTDEENADEQKIDDMDLPNEQAEDVKGGVTNAREKF